ncbi:hypothetical protein [Rhodovulum kholense]|uniref:Uncharacterized protein n=1 Tax=Rhodovulum kholense TaxID=453584 RepID=A0A8E2VIU6_9RHOB|nr:hypothetical protein [Rhodovulum kholense]PTW48340.1 hypothetical protein C8N38_10892 [Rhodovulum kholense]
MPQAGLAIAGAWSAFTASAVGSFLLTNTLGRLLVTVAVSALMRATMTKPKDPGISAKVTQAGADNPLNIPLGTYVPDGTRIAPPMTWGGSNQYATFVIALSAVPGCHLRRFALDGEWVDLDFDHPHPLVGYPVQGRYQGKAWGKYYDGTQATADAHMLEKCGGHPDYPWSADMVGEGICYAIVTLQYDRELFPSPEPRMLFELSGIPLYDPRKDPSVGGAGAHRWDQRSTWAPSDA